MSPKGGGGIQFFEEFPVIDSVKTFGYIRIQNVFGFLLDTAMNCFYSNPKWFAETDRLKPPYRNDLS
ncbi:MAG: hypothetical protein QNJ72_31940 [Pleurocapsa sp. MO_226.B13]|nr:hypothetical protein [Pleurocapsa sp. MO_226.B13]